MFNWILAAVATWSMASGSLSGPAAEGPAMQAFRAFCVAGEADAAKVGALARADGWAQGPGDGEAVQVTYKKSGADGRVLVLELGETKAEEDGSSGRHCDLTTAQTGEDIFGEASAFAGGPPSSTVGEGMWVWYYRDADGRRTPLDPNDTAAFHAAGEAGQARLLLAFSTPKGIDLGYYVVISPGNGG